MASRTLFFASNAISQCVRMVRHERGKRSMSRRHGSGGSSRSWSEAYRQFTAKVILARPKPSEAFSGGEEANELVKASMSRLARSH